MKFIVACCLALSAQSSQADTNTQSQIVPLTLLQNGDFESTNRLQGWSFLKSGSSHAEMTLDSAIPLNDQTPHSLRLAVSNAQGRCIIASADSALKINAGTWYDLTFSARSDPTNRGFGLVVSLETADGKKVCGRATIPEIGGSWKQHSLAIPARYSTPNGRLSIALFEVGTVWLDNVSLEPRKASE